MCAWPIKCSLSCLLHYLLFCFSPSCLKFRLLCTSYYWYYFIPHIFPTADNTGETVDGAFRGVTESRRLVNRSRLESADSQSDTDPSDIPSHSVPSQPVLFEDSLVLNSPRITVPKKNKAVFKHNKWSQDTTFPAVSI